jgi:uncharacterized protein DUF4145
MGAEVAEGGVMKCPHCLVNFHDNWHSTTDPRFVDKEYSYVLMGALCPACERATLMVSLNPKGGAGDVRTRMVYPNLVARVPLSSDVPSKFSGDYLEACKVINDSPKASAALSRRCLQAILREVAKVKPATLAKEIQELLDSKALPGHLAENVDAIRNIGNFAAHPLKSTNTGEILDVEPGEAEWTLDVLEGLFDFYFVQPEISRRKRDALNAKLKEAGKPSMK